MDIKLKSNCEKSEENLLNRKGCVNCARKNITMRIVENKIEYLIDFFDNERWEITEIKYKINNIKKVNPKDAINNPEEWNKEIKIQEIDMRRTKFLLAKFKR